MVYYTISRWETFNCHNICDRFKFLKRAQYIRLTSARGFNLDFRPGGGGGGVGNWWDQKRAPPLAC